MRILILLIVIITAGPNTQMPAKNVKNPPIVTTKLIKGSPTHDQKFPKPHPKGTEIPRKTNAVRIELFTTIQINLGSLICAIDLKKAVLKMDLN